MWRFQQSTGRISRVLGDNSEAYLGDGYSGHGEGRNNPKLESVKDVGPVPKGKWDIIGPPYVSDSHGPYVLALKPQAGTETYGRNGFLIHGDSKEHPGLASKGCIICPRWLRERIWTSGDRVIEVVE